MRSIDVMEHDFVLISNECSFVRHLSCEDVSKISFFEEPSHEFSKDSRFEHLLFYFFLRDQRVFQGSKPCEILDLTQEELRDEHVMSERLFRRQRIAGVVSDELKHN